MARILQLPPPQRIPIEALSQEVDVSLRRVGEAYMLYEQARQQFEAAAERLEEFRKYADSAVDRRNKIMGAIAKANELEDGTWRYDAERGALVGEVDDER